MKVKTLKDATNIVRSIQGQDSIFDSRERIALPDETLVFETGNDRDRALLLWTLLYQSKLKTDDLFIGFSKCESFVRFEGE